MSYALRFIKQNIPEIEILEYPTWDQFKNALDNNWDVVGFSFYINDVAKIKQMTTLAREKGIPELWGGNYGVLTDHMEKIFDKVFIGYAEEHIANYLGKKISLIKHPPIVNTLEFGPFNITRFGVLFTTRGCTHSCKFCQTPAFNPKSELINPSSIERVIKFYKSIGINYIGIFDENFGLHRKHAENVVRILNKYKMFWACMARAEFVAKQLNTWTKNGGRFVGAGVGIESFNAKVLEDMEKKFNPEKIIADIKFIKKNNVGLIGYYIIGFENETRESIKSDLIKLSNLQLDLNQITIVTPLPKTRLWNEIESKYGIFEQDYTKFDTKHLVWNHPKLSNQEVEQLLHWGLRLANPRRGFIKMFFKFQKLVHNFEGFRSMGILPKNIYNAKKYDTNGLKIFFDDNEGTISYKFNLLKNNA